MVCFYPGYDFVTWWRCQWITKYDRSPLNLLDMCYKQDADLSVRVVLLQLAWQNLCDLVIMLLDNSLATAADVETHARAITQTALPTVSDVICVSENLSLHPFS